MEVVQSLRNLASAAVLAAGASATPEAWAAEELSALPGAGAESAKVLQAERSGSAQLQSTAFEPRTIIPAPGVELRYGVQFSPHGESLAVTLSYTDAMGLPPEGWRFGIEVISPDLKTKYLVPTGRGEQGEVSYVLPSDRRSFTYTIPTGYFTGAALLPEDKMAKRVGELSFDHTLQPGKPSLSLVAVSEGAVQFAINVPSSAPGTGWKVQDASNPTGPWKDSSVAGPGFLPEGFSTALWVGVDGLPAKFFRLAKP